MAFAVQQAMEGLVWLGLDHGRQFLIDAGAAGFLFFSHLFWPIAVPEAGRAWFPYFRLYSPKKAFLDQTWVLPDIETAH